MISLIPCPKPPTPPSCWPATRNFEAPRRGPRPSCRRPTQAPGRRLPSKLGLACTLPAQKARVDHCHRVSNSRRYGLCEAQPSFLRVPALTLLDIHCTVHAAVRERKRERERSTTQQATAVVGGRTHNNRCCQLHPRQQTSKPIVTCAATAYRVHTYLSGYLPDNHSITGLAFQGCAALRPTAASNTQVFIIWTRTVLNRSRQKEVHGQDKAPRFP